MNNSTSNISRSESVRSSRRSNKYSSPMSSPAPPKSPSFSYHCTIDPPNAHSYYKKAPSSPSYYPQSPRSPRSESTFSFPQSPRESQVFEYPKSPKSPNVPKSPRSPRNFNYEDEISTAIGSPMQQSEIHSSSGVSSSNFSLQSPPKSKVNQGKAFHRKQYQSSKSDSSNSKSSLEYKSTTKHPNGDYQDIEYKICHSLDSDSLQSSGYPCSTISTTSRTSR